MIRWLAAVWVWVFGRRRPPPQALPPPDTLESRIAVHEAGHAVVAWCSPLAWNISGTVSDTDGNGRVSYKRHASKDPDRIWLDTVVKLAGLAAEVHVFKRFRSLPSYQDLLYARAHAQHLVSLGAASRYSTEERLLPFHRMFHTPLEQAEERILNAAYREAKRIVSHHGSKYFRLVSLFLTCKTVTEQQISTVLGSRARVVLLGKMGVVTFLCPRKGN